MRAWMFVGKQVAIPMFSRFAQLIAVFVFLSTSLPGWAQHPHASANRRPQLSMGASFSPDGRLWVVGLNASGKLFVQHTAFPGPAQFSPPQLLDTGSDEISADGENRPKIAWGPNGWVVISYTQPLSKPYTGNIRMLRSDDGGKTFGLPFTVHDDRQLITHRFESIAFDKQGNLFTLWVDKRDQPPKGSGVDYPGAAIYRKVSKDGGKTFGEDQKLADHSCECCRIAITSNGQGKLFGVWRHVFGSQTRDHAFAELAGPTNKIVRASWDEWDINACPHHGPGLAFAPARDSSPEGFHMVWFGLREKVGAVRYARLDALGHPIATTLRKLPDAGAEHADVMAEGDRVVIVWRVFEAGKTFLKTWQSEDGGANFKLSVLAESTGANDHPRLVQRKGDMAVVWRTLEKVNVYEITR